MFLIIKMILFYANFGKYLNLINIPISNFNNDKTIKLIKDFKYIYNKVFKKLKKQQIKIKNYKNKFKKNKF